MARRRGKAGAKGTWRRYQPPDEPVPEPRLRDRLSDWDVYDKPPPPAAPPPAVPPPARPQRRTPATSVRGEGVLSKVVWGVVVFALAGVLAAVTPEDSGERGSDINQVEQAPVPEAEPEIVVRPSFSAAGLRGLQSAVRAATGGTDVVRIAVDPRSLEVTLVEDGRPITYQYVDPVLTDGAQRDLRPGTTFDLAAVPYDALADARSVALEDVDGAVAWRVSVFVPDGGSAPVVSVRAARADGSGGLVELSVDGEVLRRATF